MNAERDGDRPVRQYAGEFEIHLTVRLETGEGEEEEPLRAWAERQGFKYTHIVLDRGRTPDQPMLTCYGRGNLAGQLATARQWAERLRGEGFRVARLKIEAAPWNTDVPKTDAEASALPEGLYFEHHVKLVLSGEAELATVRALAVPYAAHVSRNARRDLAAGRHERFVTQRCRGVGREEAGRRLRALLRALEDAGHAAVEVEREFVVHDDNPAVDAGWIEDEPRSG
ncbi:hypothetical protein ACFYM5_37460 [Streptomyces sp. NPDC006706]|uniref:hypothetical protein n=1 Tax=Streptomyces sp. NPDC006706 TaxID=3364761 RepID=UPI0036B088E8